MRQAHLLNSSALVGLVGLLLLTAAAPQPALRPQADDPNPPDQVVKLIFIHHSSGENWLADENGGLGLALGQNNYFVSDTNYGWGPDSIGDRTDIPDWLEWFRGAETERYLSALYRESGQHSAYTRTLIDPGGENEIVMFKSCFPNSNLEGNPDDPPASEASYSVGGAKYVYNQLLQNFITHPDKLFIVITAPPVSDPGYADNARAFNNWLVHDWLSENDYPLANVAVFDFYNVLTGLDNHHRLANGQIEHVFAQGRDTTAYPSEDDHPSADGNRKATQEFVPLLNVYYHRWKAGTFGQPTPATAPAAQAQPETPSLPLAESGAGMIDDFEAAQTFGGALGWEPSWDAATSTTIACAPDSGETHAGSSALRIDFEVAANSWATCALFFDTPQDWSQAAGLMFFARVDQPHAAFDVDLYAGDPESPETYVRTIEQAAEGAGRWVPVAVKWADLQRATWEDDTGQAFGSPDRVVGLAFGVSAPESAPVTATLWIDDLGLLSSEAAASAPPEPPLSTQEGSGSPARPFLPCAGALPLPLAVLGIVSLRRRRNRA